MKKGLIHIYTGDGKGKTTTAIGLSIRAKSRGLETLFVQFFKERDDNSEVSLLEGAGIGTLIFDNVKSPLFHPDISKNEIREEAKVALSRLRKIIGEKSLDLLILDEFVCLVSEGILPEVDAVEFLKRMPERLEVVITGKGACEKLIAIADYVTYMKKVKHPFEKNLRARKGIEF